MQDFRERSDKISVRRVWHGKGTYRYEGPRQEKCRYGGNNLHGGAIESARCSQFPRALSYLEVQGALLLRDEVE